MNTTMYNNENVKTTLACNLSSFQTPHPKLKGEAYRQTKKKHISLTQKRRDTRVPCVHVYQYFSPFVQNNAFYCCWKRESAFHFLGNGEK